MIKGTLFENNSHINQKINQKVIKKEENIRLRRRSSSNCP